jgi:gas vesicle protein
MDKSLDIERKSPNVWPYVVAASAVGGAVGYLFATQSGRKIRHAVTHPDELADNIEEARTFLETKSRMMTDRVHNILQKTKYGIEEGQRTYDEAGQQYKARVHEVQGKTVESLNRAAVTFERDIMHRICELGALYRGIERTIRTVLGNQRETDRDRLAAD